MTAARRGRCLRSVAVALSALVLAGCATFSPDGGFGAVEAVVKERLDKEVKWVRNEEDARQVREAVRELLAAPLSVDGAVQVALLNNPGLQATYAELGIAEADLVRAGRLPNPRWSLLRTRSGGELSKAEEGISFEILGILLAPLRTRIEARRFEQVKSQVSAEALRVASEARRSFFLAVSAQETARYMEQVMRAAEASAELSRRMAGVGNMSKLGQYREQAFYSEAAARLARARDAAQAERERLIRHLGLWGEETRFRLPERLPELPAAPDEIAEVEAAALAQRLDVQAAKREAEALAESLGLTRSTRLVNVLELGRARTREGDHPFAYGYEISLELPLFDWGTSRVARAEFLYRQSLHRVAEVAIAARSEVREAYRSYRAAYELARHYRDEIVPLRKRISDEVLLRYNGMLASTFELIADARDQVASVSAYIDALRDYWLAEAGLRIAMSARAAGFRPAAPAAPAAGPAPAGH